MKIFYLTTVCNEKTFEKIVSKSRLKPSASAQTFESCFLKGFSDKDRIALDLNSFVPIAAFPNGYKIIWGRKKEILNCNQETKWIPALNLHIIKQMCFRSFSALYLKKWLKDNQNIENKCVLMYSLYPPIAKSVLRLCKKNNCKCFVFIADLPNLQYTTSKPKGIKRFLAPLFRNTAVSIQNEFDGYIFFTEQMSNVIAKGKPYTVIEGVCDPNMFNPYENEDKSDNKSIMYAGLLYKKYGIDILIDAFMKTKGNYELWLFGDGDYIDEILSATIIDSRIKYFGRIPHQEVLRYEKQAHLLVNVRSNKDEYTKYSFPSKTMEYMLSGTPVLTSKLEGIPDEYYEHVFAIDKCDVDTLANMINKIFLLSKEELYEYGQNSKKWIINNKNADVQTRKLIDFLEEYI